MSHPLSHPSSSPTALYQDFIAAKRRAGCTARTTATYAERLTYFVQWIGARPLDRATLKVYLDHLQAQPISATTVAGRFRVVATLCAWLVDEGYLPHNPAARLTPRTPHYLPRVYTRAQLHALLDACDTRDRAILTLFCETGLRATELISLGRRDVRDGWVRVMGKGARERQQALLPLSQAFLAAYLRTRRDGYPALFVGRRGPLTYSGLYQTITRRCSEAGIRDDTSRLLHRLRATFAVEYIANGGEIEDLRRLLGHATRAMSEYYAQAAYDRRVAEQKRRIDPLTQMFGADRLQAYLDPS